MESSVFCCQLCKARLTLTGVEQLSPVNFTLASLEQDEQREYRPEDSFVLLESRKKDIQAEASGARSTDESFVVLGPLSPGIHSDAPGREEGNSDLVSLNSARTLYSDLSDPSIAAETSDLDEKLISLARLFELASQDSGTDHPLCIDCASQVRAQMENERRRLDAEISDYSEAVRRLEAEEDALYVLSDEDFERTMAEAEAEFEREKARAEELEARVLAAESKLRKLDDVTAHLDQLEDVYWHLFNDYSMKMQDHVDEKAAIVNKTNNAFQKLGCLRQTNVCLDAFKIDHVGPFGTISGFRMGRTTEHPVDWDEINAGWGQAVLLLHTMSSLCKYNFSVYRLVPMGSKPKIFEKRGSERRVHELYGPVSKVWSYYYDRAMIGYLSCLKEFADFAHSEDLKEGQEDVFNLPFAIEGDKIDGRTIKLSMNKDVRWTKAMKFVLADLLACMQWLCQRRAKS